MSVDDQCSWEGWRGQVVSESSLTYEEGMNGIGAVTTTAVPRAPEFHEPIIVAYAVAPVGEPFPHIPEPLKIGGPGPKEDLSPDALRRTLADDLLQDLLGRVRRLECQQQVAEGQQEARLEAIEGMLGDVARTLEAIKDILAKR